jgi:hypothetical protein
VHPRTLSFKHTVQLWSEWIARSLCHRASTSIDLLFTLIGQGPGFTELVQPALPGKLPRHVL